MNTKEEKLCLMYFFDFLIGIIDNAKISVKNLNRI